MPASPLPPPTTPAVRPSRGLAPLQGLHRRSRQFPILGRMAWWLLALPLALACWGAARPRGTARTVAWSAAVVVAIVGVVSVVGDRQPGTAEAVTATSTTERASTTTSTEPIASTASAPPTTVVTETTPMTAEVTIPPTAAPMAVPTTTPPVETASPTVPPAGSSSAADVLALVPVALEHQDSYDRALFSASADTDGDGCDTRAEVLIRDSSTPAQVDSYGCHVVAGDWLSLYDRVAVTDPSELEVDHVVALKEAWDSGAWSWSDADRIAYANDVDDARTLRAVSIGMNRSKSDKDPSNWLPPAEDDVCRYVGDWVAIKARWHLSMDESEHGRIGNLLDDRCPGLLLAPWTDVVVTTGATPASLPQPVVDVPPAPQPVVAGAVPAPATTVAPAAPSGNVSFQNCDAVRAAGAAPIHPGDPGWEQKFDRDHDGVGCE